ncbi:hypothetical protein AB0302_08775 [Micrococcus sp. NPDC078436]|uniref:hypothetical protein n=1 Tax=Micrococcus sp. NPDC078436 TaxID=3154960 RepID=UPI0034504A7E
MDLAPLPEDPGLRTGRGPLLRVTARTDATTRRRVARAWDAGKLLRLVRGVYCPVADWLGAAPWDRFTLAASAVVLARPDAVFTGATAAHLHGLPLIETPRTLHVRATTPHHHGRSTLVRQALAPGAAPLPPPPTLSPVWNPVSAPGHEPVEILLRTAGGVLLGTARAESLSTVHLQLAAGLPLRESVAPLDRLLRDRPRECTAWAAAHAELPASRAARERFSRACAFADGASESPGESLSRVLVHELGFAPPVLQHRVRTPGAAHEDRVDFWWPQLRVGGEFDGITKYDVGLHASEADRRRAIRAEKEREVRLHRLLSGLARWTWEDLRSPARLEAELARHGVPRRRG